MALSDLDEFKTFLGRAPWMDFALCKGSPDLFYPEHGRSDVSRNARAICAQCPVAEPCLEFAIQNHEEFGIWGGTTRDERNAIRRERRLVA